MTALKEYQRLECPGVWRPSSEDKRINVVVGIGDATLIMYDYNDRPQSHWSLPALVRLNGDTRPAIFAPGIDSEEELEIGDDSMIDAIEQVQKAIERRIPRKRRSKRAILAVAICASLASSIVWLPELLVTHAAAVVPDAKRIELGERLLAHIQQASRRSCHTAETAALGRLYDRLLGDRPGRLAVLPNGIAQTNHLPGGLILIDPALIENHESPDVAAGYVIAEAIRADAQDAIASMLERAGLVAALRLLATGDVTENVLFALAGALLSQPAQPVDRKALLERFRESRISIAPYAAIALDDADENALELTTVDQGGNSPALSDADWVSLQRICRG